MTRSGLFAALCAAACTLPLSAHARDSNIASCRVAVDYVLNNVVTDSYRKDFVVEPAKAFSDDFSNPLRQKSFTATAAPDSGRLVVTIDYFIDAGVFHSVGFNTKLTLHANRQIESASGSNSFQTTLGVAGNHVTNYTLTCQRQ